MEDDFQSKSIGITKFVNKTECVGSFLIEAKWLVGIFWINSYSYSLQLLDSGNWELYSYHLFPHSLAYWIHRNKVVLEAISVNASKVLSPTVYLFAI